MRPDKTTIAKHECYLALFSQDGYEVARSENMVTLEIKLSVVGENFTTWIDYDREVTVEVPERQYECYAGLIAPAQSQIHPVVVYEKAVRRPGDKVTIHPA